MAISVQHQNPGVSVLTVVSYHSRSWPFTFMGVYLLMNVCTAKNNQQKNNHKFHSINTQ